VRTLDRARGRLPWAVPLGQAYEQIRPAAPAALPKALRDDGVYLITGGLGNVGLELAQYLARHRASEDRARRPYALAAKEAVGAVARAHDESHPRAARSGVSSGAVEAAGAVVLVCQADVADERQCAPPSRGRSALRPVVRGNASAGRGKARRADPVTAAQRLAKSSSARAARPSDPGEGASRQEPRFLRVHSSLAAVMGSWIRSYTAAHLLWMRTCIGTTERRANALENHHWDT